MFKGNFTKTSALFVFSMFSAIHSANAQTTRTCEYTAWSGGPRDVVQSWLGIGFALNVENGELAMEWEDGRSIGVVTTAIDGGNLVTYRFSAPSSDIANQRLDARYSWRLYQNGRCDALIEALGFRSMSATGTWQ